MNSNERGLYFVVFFPAFAGGMAFEECIGPLVVGNLLGVGVELEGPAEALGNAAEHKHLGEGTGDGEFGVTLFFAHGSKEEVSHVALVGFAPWNFGEVRAQFSHFFFGNDP